MLNVSSNSCARRARRLRHAFARAFVEESDHLSLVRHFAGLSRCAMAMSAWTLSVCEAAAISS